MRASKELDLHRGFCIKVLGLRSVGMLEGVAHEFTSVIIYQEQRILMILFSWMSWIRALQFLETEMLTKAIQRSFLVSADMAHALHPNYMDKHEENHQPKLHGGLVIKHNANQRYATTAVTSFIFREIAMKHNLPIQDFVVRNDMPCGSTIGPILASGVGIRTVDVGAPQLSMHSIREMCAVDDVKHSYEHFKAFFQEFSQLDTNVTVDA